MLVRIGQGAKLLLEKRRARCVALSRQGKDSKVSMKDRPTPKTTPLENRVYIFLQTKLKAYPASGVECNAHLDMCTSESGRGHGRESLYIYVLAFLKLKACATASVPPGTE